MIRELRTKEKLENYYKKFTTEGIIDPSVHPWIGESWRRCQLRNIESKNISSLPKLTALELQERQEAGQQTICFVDGLYENIKQYLSIYDINLLLVDEESYILKNYSSSLNSDIFETLVGKCISERNIGTTSISIAKEHKTPFLLFGAENWSQAFHETDSFTVPIMVDGILRYLLTFFSFQQEKLPYDLLNAIILSFKYSLENYLVEQEKNQAFQTLLDELPACIYCIRPGGKVTYANQPGQKRLNGKNHLGDVFLNYEHIPINKAFLGTPSHHKEVTWISQDKTYEDITTVLPIKVGDEINSIIAASFSIEDLKTIIAHATSYRARYKLLSMVGETSEFNSLKNKAARIAKTNSNILLQGEPGTGKQRLAHGIHQASPRAANPLIVIKCGKVSESILDAELFGHGNETTSWTEGKLELADTGTLFIDEIEKLPINLGDKLAAFLEKKSLPILGKDTKLDVRVIAACDSNLKRLSDKGLFSKNLYQYLSKLVIRIPSLRERSSDIKVLSKHILSEIAIQHSLPTKSLSEQAITLLQKCSWNGNIKQLQGVLEMAFFHTPGSIINSENIKLPGDSTIGKSWKHDKDAFVETWKAAGGNISKLSLMLDVSRVTLYRYLKKYGLVKS